MSDNQFSVEMSKAEQSSRYMVAIWHIEDGCVVYFRQTHDFPTSDFDAAMKLLEEDLANDRHSSQESS